MFSHFKCLRGQRRQFCVAGNMFPASYGLRKPALLYSTNATQYLPGVQWSKLELTIHLHICGTSRATTTRHLLLDLPSKFYRLSIRSDGLYKLLAEPI